MHFDLGFLQTFIVLAETASFSRTAERLGLSQPSVSRQVKVLEETVGVLLVERDRQSVRLTEEGERFLERIEPLVTDLRAALEMKGADADADPIAGDLRIAALAQAGETLLLPPLIALNERFPGLDVSLSYMREAEVIAALKSGEADIGLLATPLTEESFHTVKVAVERIIVVTRAGNWRDLAAPRDAAFVTQRRQDPLFEAFIRRFYPRTSLGKLRQAFAVNSHRSMIAVLQSQDAYAVVPDHSVRKELEANTLRQASPHTMEGGLYLAAMRGSLQKQRVRTCFERLVAAHL